MNAKLIQPRSFYVGKKYLSYVPKSPQEYLDVALQAERYIAARQVVTPDGIYWSENAVDFTDSSLTGALGLYNGSAGILYFYLKLYQVTKQQSYYEITKQATQYLCKHLKENFPQEIHSVVKYGAGVSLDIGILGISGIGYVLAEIYQRFEWDFVENALHEMASFYLEHAIRREGEACWTESTTMITDSGALLFLLKYHSLFQDIAIETLIKEVGEWFLKQAILLPDGSVRYAGLECVWEGIKPNFEVGTAGSGFVLARLYEFTGKKEYLEMAKKCADFLIGCQIPQKKGALIPFRWDSPEQSLCYLGTCSGPAGTCRFFYLLYQLTGDSLYQQEIVTLVDGMEAVGAPEFQSPGLWNNLTMCCGHAGILQFFISLYLTDGNERWYRLAERTAQVILGEKDTLQDESVRWQVALERIKPDVFSEHLGYYTGTAGIAASLLQMYLLEKHQFHWERFMDDPFPVEMAF